MWWVWVQSKTVVLHFQQAPGKPELLVLDSTLSSRDLKEKNIPVQPSPGVVTPVVLLQDSHSRLLTHSAAPPINLRSLTLQLLPPKAQMNLWLTPCSRAFKAWEHQGGS
jgi:hypothetical protein